ncbi:MAG: hypothetical protein V1876_01525 [Candidatus Peregrinibacteria bacterium]
MNPPDQSSVSDAYHHKYSGKTLLLKVSGKTLLSEHVPALVQDVQELSREGIHFILVCGAGEQNTRHLKDYLAQTGQEWTEPERVGGRRVTDERQMLHGVLPAHQSIRALFHALLSEATILEPVQLHCTHLADLGFVGDPQAIEGLNEGAIVVVPSVGSDGQKLLNVNADDTARTVAAQECASLNEVIFVTETGGVLHKGSVAPLLWEEDIAADGRHAHIDVTGGGGGMQKKLCEAKKMLQWIEKVVITGVAGVRQEIERILGSGTLVVARSSVRCEPPPHESADDVIFDALYRKNVATGNFRPRSPQELQELKKYVYLLKVSNSILGAFVLLPHGSFLEFATMCSDYNGTGIGDVILRTAQQSALLQKKDIYAFASSPESAALFTRNHFENLGHVSALQKEHPTFYEFLSCVRNYDVSKRDPCFCMWRPEVFSKRK